MNKELEAEDILMQVRDKLQKESVKLWVKPYYDRITGPLEENVSNLAKEYSQTLKLDYVACRAAIVELQSNAINKIKQREQFGETGMATLKVKVLNQVKPISFLKEVPLSMKGLEFKEIISKEISLPVERLKLICNGAVIEDSLQLTQKGVKNASHILVIALNQSLSSLQENESRFKEIESTRADTSLLANDNSYMHLEDQHGNVVNIPAKEKVSLMVAIALHEKGRNALKNDDYARALVFFLDADSEFSQCNSALLEKVDNYALLDLDIAWCYLCLQSLNHLPEARLRLKRCEEAFHRSYGANLERLIAVKGSMGNESALFMRLHLLQAIVTYHENKRAEALELFRKSQNELVRLKVDPRKMENLVQMGYSLAEARLGLRATNGDIDEAISFINQNRSKRDETRKKVLAEKILQGEKRKLGKCVDGKQYVEPRFLNMLINMGYPKIVAKRALQQCNNIISDSIQFIHEQPLPGPSSTKSQELLSFIEDLLPELVSAGFDPKMAKIALENRDGDIQLAMEDLLSNNGRVESFAGSSESNNDVEKNDEVCKKEKKLKDKAWSRLSQDISAVDDDHLDLSLEKEEEFLNQYLKLML